MTNEEIISKFDHTLLKVDMTENGVDKLCKEAVSFGTASVCLPPCFIDRAKANLAGSDVKVCTVIGFPNGYSTTESKVFECRQAIQLGADEIDMVINVAMLKSGNLGYVEREIKEVRLACKDKILKVIVETGALTETEKRVICEIVQTSGADFIKTSTGFGFSGAKAEDIELFARVSAGKLKIKASGGIRSLDDACKMLKSGASRIGESSALKN